MIGIFFTASCVQADPEFFSISLRAHREHGVRDLARGRKSSRIGPHAGRDCPSPWSEGARGCGERRQSGHRSGLISEAGLPDTLSKSAVSSFEQWRSARPARLPAGLEAIEDDIPQKVDGGVGSVASGVNGDEYAGVELRCQTDDGIPTGIGAGVSEYRVLNFMLMASSIVTESSN